MKTSKVLLLTAVLLVLLLISALPVSAKSGGAIKCDMPMVIDFHDESPFPFWKGDVIGCELEGVIRFDVDPSTPPKFPGNTYHFYELFIIEPDSGGYISGSSAGMVAFSNWKFRSHGVVTDASPEWEHLIGSRYYSSGTVDPPVLEIPGYALDTTMMITP